MDIENDTVEKSANKENPVVCDICRHKKDFNIATFFCIICRFLFCVSCAECHQEIPKWNDHFLVCFNASETSKLTLDAAKNVKTDEKDVVDSDFIFLEEKRDVPLCDESTSSPFFDATKEKNTEGCMSPRVIKIGDPIRKLISLPNGCIIIQLCTRILVFSKDYEIMTELDSPRHGHLTQTNRKGVAIVTPVSVTEVKLSDQEAPKITNVVPVKSVLTGSLLDVSYDDGMYFIIALCPEENESVLLTKSCNTTSENRKENKCTQSFHLYVLYEGNLISQSKPLLGCKSDLDNGKIYCAAAKRRVFVSNDDGIFCISMYGEVVSHIPPFKNMVENPYAFVSAIFVDDDMIYQVVNEDLPESSVCYLYAAHTATKETKKFRLDCCLGYISGKRLGAMVVQKSLDRVVLQNGENIEVFELGNVKS